MTYFKNLIHESSLADKRGKEWWERNKKFIAGNCHKCGAKNTWTKDDVNVCTNKDCEFSSEEFVLGWAEEAKC